jgi:hypothetical protein
LTEIGLQQLNLPYYKHIVPAETWRNSNKSKYLYQLLTSEKQKPYTLYLDSTDVIVMNNLNRLLKDFVASPHKMWMNTEFIFYPEKKITIEGKRSHTRKFKNFQNKTTNCFSVRNLECKYLNSGVILAETPFLRGLLKEVADLIKENPSNSSDQFYYHGLYQKHYGQIWLDTQCHYMQAFGGDGFLCDDNVQWGLDLVKNLSKIKSSPSKKSLILTISLGDRKDIFKYTRPTIEAYAKKYGHELIIIDTYGQFKKHSISIWFTQIDIIKHYLNYYDRIAYFDDTCIIHPETKSLFNIVPETMFGAYIESRDFDRKLGLGDKGKNSIRLAYDHYSQFESEPFQYSNEFIMINAGVLVISKIHQHLFETNKYQLKPLTFHDQCFTSYQLNKNRTGVFDLGIKYNTVGSYLQLHKNNLKSLVNNGNHRVFHVTRGAGEERLSFLRQIANMIQ